MKLIANALTCERNGRVVFSGLSFSAEAGQLVELRGANGAGKSSLLRMIAGLVPLAGGSLRVEDGQADTALAQHCHYAGHQDGIKAALTPRETLHFWACVLGGGDAETALVAFGLLPLADQPSGILSAGQRRRLALARLLLGQRALWLLDEPMTALDAANQVILRDVMQRHLQDGGLIIAASHGDLGMTAHHTVMLGA